MFVMNIRGLGIRGLGMGAVIVRVVVMLDGIAARIARMRAENRNQAREYGTQQWQEDDRLNHNRVSPSSD
jgi:hypothetical protein